VTTDHCAGLKADHCEFNSERLFVDVSDSMFLGAGSLGTEIRKRATAYCLEFPRARVVVQFGNGRTTRDCR